MARTARSLNTPAALALAGALLMTGCSSAQSSADEPAATPASKTPRPTHIPTPAPTAPVQPSDGATHNKVVLGSLKDQTQFAAFESNTSSTGRILLDMSCTGDGELVVAIPAAGVTSTIPCDPDGSQLMANSFPAPQVAEPFQVVVSGTGVERWSAELLEDTTEVRTGP